MSMSKRGIKLLLCAGGILVLAAVYFLLFKPSQEKNELVRQENEQLSQQVEQLKVLETQREMYETETASMQAEVDLVLKDFPSEILPETAILYMREYEKKDDMEISNLSLVSDNLLYTLGQTPSADGTIPPADPAAVSLFDRQISCTFQCPYDSFKDVVKKIQEYKFKQNVEALTLSFDTSSGKLSGNMTVNMNHGTNTENEPMEIESPDIKTGVNNIFGIEEKKK